MGKLSLKKISNEKKYFMFFFLFLMLYNFIYTNKCHFFTVGDIPYTAHIMDFSFGFCTKFLVGEVFGLFFKKVTMTNVTVFETVLLLLVFVFVSFCLSKIISLYDNKEDKRAFFILALFFLSGPCTFAMFTDELGMYDVYWIYICALFFLCFKNKVLRFVIPILFFGAIMLHFTSLLCYIPLMFLVVLYEVAQSDNKLSNRLYIIILFISALVVVGITLYMFINERDNLVYKTMKEFNEAAYKKSQFGKDTEMTYYDMSFFDTSDTFKVYIKQYKPIFKNVNDYAVFKGLPKIAKSVIDYLISRLNQTGFLYFVIRTAFVNAVYIFILFTPIYILLFKFWVFKIKGAETKLLKLIYLAMLLLLFNIIPFLTFAIDITRMYTHSFLTQCFMIAYLMYRDKSNLEYFTNKISGCNKGFLFTYYAIYALSYFYPYY
ncbi:MAG: hypothetical protein IJT65_05350 [Eubacterium sp.]|nr:hypothetical protein [Eubacterium sp.]